MLSPSDGISFLGCGNTGTGKLPIAGPGPVLNPSERSKYEYNTETVGKYDSAAAEKNAEQRQEKPILTHLEFGGEYV